LEAGAPSEIIRDLQQARIRPLGRRCWIIAAWAALALTALAEDVAPFSVTAARAGDTTILLDGPSVPVGAELSIVTPPKLGAIFKSFPTGARANQWAAIYRIETPPSSATATDRFSYAVRFGGKQIGKSVEVSISFSKPHPKLSWMFRGSVEPVVIGATARHYLRITNKGSTPFTGDLPSPPFPWVTEVHELRIPAGDHVDVLLSFSAPTPRMHIANWVIDPKAPDATAVLTAFSPGRNVKPPVTATSPRPRPSGGSLKLSAVPPILYIGDSLSVGGFGEVMQATLMKGIGPQSFAMYASGGSSVQSWMAAHPTYTTRCGYRETRPGKTFLDEKSGPAYPTPKIEQLLPAFRPEILIIQLGTNHFDTVLEGGKNAIPSQQRLLESFAASIREHGKTVKLVIWITPPDSSHYPPEIENIVTQLIIELCARHGFKWVESRRFTRYVPGKSGSDGIHFNDGDAKIWAASVIDAVNAIITQTGWSR
jgi:hypothetical protein